MSSSASTIRPGPTRRGPVRALVILIAWCVALSISITLSPSAASTAAADTPTDTATVLDGYRLADTPAHRELLRAAVADQLAAGGTAATSAAIDTEIARLATLDDTDITFTAYLAVELFDAIFAPVKTPAQAAFHGEFQRYYGETQLRIASATLRAWNEYVDPSLPTPEYGACCTLSVLSDTGPSVKGFTPPNNAVGIGSAGYEALDGFFAPVADAGIPEIAELFDELGYEPEDGDAAVTALEAGAGFSAASLALLYGTFAAYLSQAAAVTTTISNTEAAVVASKVVQVIVEKTVTTLTTTVGGAASTFAISALIVIPLLIAGGMKIAEFAETQKFEAELDHAVSNPDFEPDFDAIVGTKTEFDAGLWYAPCADGHDGVATRCYSTDCPAGYVVSALNCTQFADTITKDTYDRGAGQIPTGCPAGQALENGLCYPACPDGFASDGATLCYQRCPIGWSGTLTTCNQPTQFWNTYIATHHDLCIQNTGSCTLRGALYYVDCAAPYVFASLQTCEIPCPSGWADGGIFCHRPAVSRGAGSVPSACVNGLEYLAGLCYVPCVGGYSPIVTICLQDLVCPTGYSDTGLTCFRGFATFLRSFYDRGVGASYGPSPDTVEANKATIFSFLLKMLIADPADHGTISSPRIAPTPADSIPTPNVAPTITLLGTTTDEGSVASVPGVVYDPNPGDTHTVTIDWGDGDGPVATDLVALTTQTHRYTDDGTYTVTAIVTDAEGETATATADVIVMNVVPDVSVTGASIDEGDIAAVNASFTDPGTDDTHTATIDWGDGTAVESVDPADLASLSHEYVQDGVFDVTVTVTDDDAAGVATATVAVANVAPTVTADGASIIEGDTATVEARFTDPGSADDHTALVDWGDGSAPASVAIASLSDLAHQYGDDGVYDVAVTVNDDDTSSTVITSVTVANASPSLSGITTSAPATTVNDCLVIRTSEPFDLTVHASDPGSDDLTVAWSTGHSSTYFNDGSGPDGAMTPAGVYPFLVTESLSSTALPLGGGTLVVSATDDDGASTSRDVCAVAVGDESESGSARAWAARFESPEPASAELLGSYLSSVAALSSVFDETTDVSTPEGAGAVLDYHGSDQHARLRAALLAGWLNVASGAAEPDERTTITVSGATHLAGLLVEAERALADPDATHSLIAQVTAALLVAAT